MNHYLLMRGKQKAFFEYLIQDWISSAIVEKYLLTIVTKYSLTIVIGFVKETLLSMMALHVLF